LDGDAVQRTVIAGYAERSGCLYLDVIDFVLNGLPNSVSLSCAPNGKAIRAADVTGKNVQAKAEPSVAVPHIAQAIVAEFVAEAVSGTRFAAPVR